MGSMQNIQMTRRNDRGYNSDMDGGNMRGGGRGSMRGRGRGSRGGPGRHSEPRYNTTGSSTTFSDYINMKKGAVVNGRGRGHIQQNTNNQINGRVQNKINGEQNKSNYGGKRTDRK